MRTIPLKKPVMLLIAAIALSGCAHAISSELRQQSRKDLPFSAVLRNPDVYLGQTVIWGGRIIETVNRENETLVKVLQMPLDYYGMPEDEERSQGRFLARIQGYVDNEIYREGRMVTVAGEISGKETEPLGETQYTYPVITVKEIHLWKQTPIYGPPLYWEYYRYDYYGPYPRFRPYF